MKIRRFVRRMLYLFVFLLAVWAIAVQAGCLAMRTPDREWPAKMAQKGQTLAPQFLDIPSTTGRSIHAVVLPARDRLPWVMLVHGSPGSADAYLDYLSDTVLSARANLVAVDRAGFGYSDFGRPDTSLVRQAQDLRAVAERLAPGQRWILVGHSLGGPLVVRFAMDYPELSAGLVVVAGSVDPALEPQQWWVPWIDNPPLRWLTPKSLWASNHEIRYLKNELTRMLPLWSRLQCPVQIVHALDDRLVPFGNVAFMQAQLAGRPGIHTTVYDSGDHFILWSRVKEIRELILRGW
jgi:pimeloyl-ACP methyl ester carboxylesterase